MTDEKVQLPLDALGSPPERRARTGRTVFQSHPSSLYGKRGDGGARVRGFSRHSLRPSPRTLWQASWALLACMCVCVCVCVCCGWQPGTVEEKRET